MRLIDTSNEHDSNRQGGPRLDPRQLTYTEPQCIKLLRMDVSKDLVAASATPLVLAILAEGDSYGYAIIKRVAELSGGHLQWTDGMLYPVLHRLEDQITEWRTYLRRRNAVNGADVEELEGHLRDQLTALIEAGLTGDEAF